MVYLNFIPRTNVDANEFKALIDGSDFFAEWHSEGYFSFEDDEDTVDELEYHLQVLISATGINGHFETETA